MYDHSDPDNKAERGFGRKPAITAHELTLEELVRLTDGTGNPLARRSLHEVPVGHADPRSRQILFKLAGFVLFLTSLAHNTRCDERTYRLL